MTDLPNASAILPDTPHALPAADVLAALTVTPASGLDDDEVRRRAAAFGPNTIVARRKVSALAVLLHQFRSPVVYLLAAAAALAFYFGEWEEGGAIVAVLALNALIGFVRDQGGALDRSIARARDTLGAGTP